MYLNVLLLPLLNFFFISFWGYYLGRKGSSFISVLGIFFAFLISAFILFEVSLNLSPVSIKLYNWIYLDIYSIEIGFIFDTVTSLMLFVITFISFVVHLYSTTYLEGDPYLSRFMSYLSLFTFFMLLLVTSDNFLQVFIGWEGVGLCSYLLINFWFTRILANKAALKAMIMNRIADVIFLMAVAFIFLKFKTTDFIIVFNLIPFILDEVHFFLFKNFNSIELIAFFFFVGAIGKSAQIGFHTWLPDAMEGPTPVSALLHAATMVTAGVFLIIRCSFFMEYSENILFILVMIGCISTFFAGFVAIFQYDIKKIIAYSTCSQLGYMFISCGLSHYNLAMFHLFNHAFFKALLFLSAGAVIHAFFDEQDMRKYGGNLLVILPFTYICFIIGSLAIMGFPFLTGFYSKELIIELGFKRFIIDSSFIYVISLLSAAFTSIYSCKLLVYTFINRSLNGFKSNYFAFNQSNMETIDNMFYAMFILAIMSIFIGYIFNDLIFGLGTLIWGNSIFILNFHENILSFSHLPFFIKDLPLIFAIIGIIYICSFFKIFTTFDLKIFKEKKNFFNFLNVNVFKYIGGFFFICLNFLYFIEVKLIGSPFLLSYNFIYPLEISSQLKKVKYLDSLFSISSILFKEKSQNLKLQKLLYYKIYLPIYNIGYNAFFFNNLYNYIFIFLYKLFYIINVKYIDKGIFEYFGPFIVYEMKKNIIKDHPYLYFWTIYFVLFIQFFFFLLIIIVCYFFFLDFYCLTNLGILTVLFLINFIKNDKNFWIKNK